jgi:uncharacterized membrane protein
MHAYVSETVLAAGFASLHHLAAFTLVAALAAESVLIEQARTVEVARIVRAADAVYGVAAGVLLLVGLIRAFYFEKGASYYFRIWTFIAKLTLFAAIAILSIVCNGRIPILARVPQSRQAARDQRKENAPDPCNPASRACISSLHLGPATRACISSWWA